MTAKFLGMTDRIDFIIKSDQIVRTIRLRLVSSRDQTFDIDVAKSWHQGKRPRILAPDFAVVTVTPKETKILVKGYLRKKDGSTGQLPEEITYWRRVDGASYTSEIQPDISQAPAWVRQLLDDLQV